MSQFDELLAQLQAEQEEQSTLAKALPEGDGEDDQAIQAAAAEGDEGQLEAEDKNPEDDDEADEALTKSIVIDEEEFQVVDAEQLIKSLQALTGRVETQESALVKAMTSMVETVKAQGDLIKSLQSKIEKLGSQGAGRKTVLTVHEKPAAGEPLAKSQPEGLTVGEVLAKANAAFDAGKITGLELTAVDVSIRSNQPIDQTLLSKVLA